MKHAVLSVVIANYSNRTINTKFNYYHFCKFSKTKQNIDNIGGFYATLFNVKGLVSDEVTHE